MLLWRDQQFGPLFCNIVRDSLVVGSDVGYNDDKFQYVWYEHETLDSWTMILHFDCHNEAKKVLYDVA